MKILLRTLFLGVVLLGTSLNSFSRAYSVKAQSNNKDMGSVDIISLPITENRKVRVVCMGNSITYGHGIVDREKNSYPAVLQELFGDAFDVLNCGVNGHTLLSKGDIPYKNSGAYVQAKNFQPDIVIIKLGTNDTKPQNWIYKSEFDKDYMGFINELRALPSHPRIYMCTALYVPNSGDISEERVRDGVNPMVKEIAARESIDVIDMYSVTKDRPELYHDGLHPNAAGARLMAEYAHKRIIETLAVNNPYIINVGPENVWVVSTPAPGHEFVNWSAGTNVYDQPSVLYSQNKGITFTATFKQKDKAYCYPLGTIENSRYLKKLWAEADGRRTDLIGSPGTDVTSHSGNLCIGGNNIVTVERGGSFTLKSSSNNPGPSSSVDPIRYAVILPFADWNGDLEYGGRDTNESLPMIGRAGNTSGTDADAMAVVSLNNSFTVPADAKLGKTHFRLNYTDGKSADVGYGSAAGVTHTACSVINKGISVEITLNIIEKGARFNFASAAGANGSVETATSNGAYAAFTEIKLKAVPADENYWFMNWTDQDGNIVSKNAEFTHTLIGDISLTANFEERHYPRLTHYYMSKTQVNRFLNKVTYTASGSTKTLFDLGTSFTSIPVDIDIYDGPAVVSNLDPRIVLPEGTSSFTITCFSTHRAIAGCNNELGWCNQAAMVDWNNDFAFAGSEIYTPTNFSGAEIPGHTFGNVSGYSRTIAVPAGQKSGIYRMYVMYGEPAASSSVWPSEMLAEGRVRDGNVYEFDIQLGTVSGLENVSNSGASVYVSGDVLYINSVKTGSIINVIDISGKPVQQTVAASESNHCVLPGKGVYIVNIQNGGQSSNFKVIY